MSITGKLVGPNTSSSCFPANFDEESKFYAPAYLIEKYVDGTLWFKIDDDEAKSKFMIATARCPWHFAKDMLTNQLIANAAA